MRERKPDAENRSSSGELKSPKSTKENLDFVTRPVEGTPNVRVESRQIHEHPVQTVEIENDQKIIDGCI